MYNRVFHAFGTAQLLRNDTINQHHNNTVIKIICLKLWLPSILLLHTLEILCGIKNLMREGCSIGYVIYYVYCVMRGQHIYLYRHPPISEDADPSEVDDKPTDHLTPLRYLYLNHHHMQILLNLYYRWVFYCSGTSSDSKHSPSPCDCFGSLCILLLSESP